MDVSVVIPTLNEAQTLPSTLADLEAAIALVPDHTVEVLVVDSESEDETVPIARDSSVVDRICTAPPGILYARDEGIRQARGDVVVSVDADTRYAEEHLAALLAPFEADEDVVLTYGPAFGERRVHVDAWLRLALQYGLRPLGAMWVSGANRAMDRSAYESLGGYDLSFDSNDVFRVMYEEQFSFPRRLSHIGGVRFCSSARAYQSARTLEQLFLLDRKQGGREWGVISHYQVKPRLKSAVSSLFGFSR